jgi:hypothetical protein
MLVLVHVTLRAIARTAAMIAPLWSNVRGLLAQARADRTRIEAELFHGRCHLSSKNDDDLPLVR